eukprot:gene4114-4670_t
MAVEVSANVNTVVVREDTDLLILLLYHAKENTNQVFFCPEQKQNAKKKRKVWDIQLCECVLGSKICQCILFLHAFLGCDTTSSIFGIGKGLSIKAFNKSEQFQQCASIFCDESSLKEQVCEAGEKALITMYNSSQPRLKLDQRRSHQHQRQQNITACVFTVKRAIESDMLPMQERMHKHEMFLEEEWPCMFICMWRMPWG